MNHLVPAGPFERVRVRWLPLVAVITVMVFGWLSLVLAVSVDLPGWFNELAASLLYLPVVVWVVAVAARRRIRLSLLFARPRIGRYWWTVVGMTAAAFTFSIGAATITSVLVPDYTARADVSPSAGWLPLLITLVIVPPVVEELVFRGVLVERWSVKWRPGIAVVVQAVCFGILHVDPVGAGVFGLVTALLYLRTRSLWPGIVMHALNNGVVLVAVMVGGEQAGAGDPLDPAGAIATGLVLMALGLPFLIAFAVRNWPDARTRTPYQLAEFGPAALPPCRVGVVTASSSHVGDLGRVRLQLSEAGVVLTRRRQVVTWAPWPTITWIAVSADYRDVVLRAGDGTGAQLRLPQRSRRARVAIVQAIGERSVAVTGTVPTWLVPAR